tara:strand:+ start:622 stop:933 length:312 start_codon:yes stop_codon:yes gene_type:complete
MEKSTQTYEIIEEYGSTPFTKTDLEKFASLFKYDKEEHINKLNDKLLAPFNFQELYSEEYYRDKFKGFPSHFYELIANADGFIDKRTPPLTINRGEYRPFKDV